MSSKTVLRQQALSAARAARKDSDMALKNFVESLVEYEEAQHGVTALADEFAHRKTQSQERVKAARRQVSDAHKAARSQGVSREELDAARTALTQVKEDDHESAETETTSPILETI